MTSISGRLSYICKDKRNLPNALLRKSAKLFDVECYIRLKFRLMFGYDIHLDKPQTFNEKLNWLKLHYHNPIMTTMADKYWAKLWVASKIGEEYVVPCYGHWRRVDDIDFDRLPEVFYLKSNQDSGGGMLVDKRRGVNLKAINNRFSSKNISRKNWYWPSREWAYKYIEPCILAEEYLDEGTGHELHDYKFWCFNGTPTYMYITNKGKVIKENFYDMDFRVVNIDHGFDRTVPEYNRPVNFEIMKKLATTLSKGLPFSRIDFFNVNGRVYFGECTFYDWAGFRPFGGEWDAELGKHLDISHL